MTKKKKAKMKPSPTLPKKEAKPEVIHAKGTVSDAPATPRVWAF